MARACFLQKCSESTREKPSERRFATDQICLRHFYWVITNRIYSILKYCIWYHLRMPSGPVMVCDIYAIMHAKLVCKMHFLTNLKKNRVKTKIFHFTFFPLEFLNRLSNVHYRQYERSTPVCKIYIKHRE